MVHATTKRMSEQERDRLRKLVLERGGDRFTLAVLSYALSRKDLDDKLRKFASRRPPEQGQQQRVIVVKDGGPADSDRVIDSGDGKTAYVVRRGARKLGLEGTVLGNAWTAAAPSSTSGATPSQEVPGIRKSGSPSIGAALTGSASRPQLSASLSSDHDLLHDLFDEEARRRFRELADSSVAHEAATIPSLQGQRKFREVQLRTNNAVADPKHERGGINL